MISCTVARKPREGGCGGSFSLSGLVAMAFAMKEEEKEEEGKRLLYFNNSVALCFRDLAFYSVEVRSQIHDKQQLQAQTEKNEKKKKL